jgi:molybdenum cofactor synthesis domain-containing protein
METTSAIIIIGNEILSGKTQDKNVSFIAKRLAAIGISLTEVRIIPDIEDVIIDTVNILRKKNTFVFTTGGIGPTHDDITAKSIAKAINTELCLNKEAHKQISDFYKSIGEELNIYRERMAMIPKGAELIDNDLTKAPGFRIENVFVLAGVPKILENMFSYVEQKLPKSDPICTKILDVSIGESKIAGILEDIQEKFKDIDIGSYPYETDFGYNTEIVFKGKSKLSIEEAYIQVRNLVHKKGFDTK